VIKRDLSLRFIGDFLKNMINFDFTPIFLKSGKIATIFAIWVISILPRWVYANSILTTTASLQDYRVRVNKKRIFYKKCLPHGTDGMGWDGMRIFFIPRGALTGNEHCYIITTWRKELNLFLSTITYDKNE
jgi:hypothetical protein